METLLLQSKSKRDMRMLAELAKKIGLRTKFVSIGEIEDVGLAIAMKKGRTGQYVNTETYLKKLKGK